MANQDASFTQNVVAKTEASHSLITFWEKAQEEISHLQQHHFKTQDLPLARIKKIMKLDEDVKMISAEAPVLFAKAAELFISELSLRAWIHTEDNKRRTLQRNDIAMAISKFDQFDFLIDIVPRDEMPKPTKTPETTTRTSLVPDQVQYYFQLAQQHQAALSQQNQVQQTAVVTSTVAPTTAAPAQQQTVQLQVINPQGQMIQQPLQVQLPGAQGDGGLAQVLQIGGQQATQLAAAQTTTATPAAATPQQTTQVLQQIVTANGEVQNIPIQLTPQQLLQIQSLQPKAGGQQQIILQTGTQQAGQGDQQQTTQQIQQPMFQIQQMAGQGGQQVIFQQTPGVIEVDQSQVEASETS